MEKELLDHLNRNLYDYGARFFDPVSAIGLITGGHIHTFPDNSTAFLDLRDTRPPVSQAGWSGLKLGRVDFEFGPSRRINKLTGNSIAVI